MPATRFHIYECRDESCPRSRRFVCELSMTVPVAVGKGRKPGWRWAQPTYHYGPTARIAEKKADVAFHDLQEKQAKSKAGEAARVAGRKRQALTAAVAADMEAERQDEARDG
ncbi:hypothetical protein A7A08_01665 [Methyloligella halotolerans]|uniref:Uncharacterized protein n=1 Tax=Methyloligella halotolerans TaxID=1177755 RepID=A0A1E2RZP9_9HYPH|nr:hypothetical protein [Methyloligella halotolerans]ODA67630.1 hypothetical protein A7A08_01665 [Methyloligella halotolerans]